MADAEMVRRAEYALGKAIRKGQAEGVIACRGGNGSNAFQSKTTDDAVLRSPYDFATHGELYGDGRAGGNGVYAMAEATDDQFETALTEAKDEGNLSRANVQQNNAPEVASSGALCWSAPTW